VVPFRDGPRLVVEVTRRRDESKRACGRVEGEAAVLSGLVMTQVLGACLLWRAIAAHLIAVSGNLFKWREIHHECHVNEFLASDWKSGAMFYDEVIERSV